MSLARKRVLASLLLSYGLSYLGTRHSGLLVHKTAASGGDVFHHVAVGDAALRAVPAMRPALFLFFYPGVAVESLTWALMDPASKHERKEMMMMKAEHAR